MLAHRNRTNQQTWDWSRQNRRGIVINWSSDWQNVNIQQTSRQVIIAQRDDDFNLQFIIHLQVVLANTRDRHDMILMQNAWITKETSDGLILRMDIMRIRNMPTNSLTPVFHFLQSWVSELGLLDRHFNFQRTYQISLLRVLLLVMLTL